MQEINIDWIDISKHKPEFIEVMDSPIEGKGAFTKKNIKENTFLGNYMGKITNDFVTGPYVFHSQKNNNIISIDASDINHSNWTRYMNCSIDKKTENVKSYFLTNKENYVTKSGKINLEGYIVFYSNREIKKGEELMYYYGDAYADLMNIKYKI